jgi:TniQ
MNGANSQTQTLYQSWDISLPEIPPRSRLYCLAPIGVGAPDVESLASFIMRLAAAHCVETGTLFAQEMALLINRSYFLKSETEPIGHALHLLKEIHSVNGGGPAIPRWVIALESLTCQRDLHLLTMLPWRNMLTPRFLMRNTRAWCPDCLAESKDRHEPVYERLIWTLIPVSVCVPHQRLLEESCPFCGRSSRVLTVRSRVGHCFRCDRWLGSDNQAKTSRTDQPEEDLIQRIEKARIVGEMLTISADLPSSLSPRDFADLLNRYARQVTDGNAAAFARFLGFDYLMVRALRYGLNRPMLDVFVTLILRLGLSVKEFLDGKETKIELPNRREYQLPPRTLEARELMQAAVMDPSCPSVSELSGRIGYKNEGNLRQADPELCKEISARNRRVRKYDPQAHKSFYGDQTLREKLSVALLENPAPSLKQIAEDLGYKFPSSLKSRCPDLCYALMERRQTYLKEWKGELEEKLKAVLSEEPPPTLRAIVSRLGMRNEGAITYHFPDLAKTITDRHREYRKNCREKAKLTLESALTEVPPHSIHQIARNTKFSLTGLYRHYPDLCHRVAANRIDYLHQRSQARREKDKAKIKQAVLGLAAQGIFPSAGQIVQLPICKNMLRPKWAREYHEELLREITTADKAEKC